ncbi:MAG TPA: cation:proton antiporter [Bacillota bacterium]|jgi:NhaP-type Na+/H+ or K+/H+ antiporter|nr:cation:proton antiporter [Bacillota bacterium]HPZ14236.1 cation:proton antiporter [Bacillota bacterium]HQD80408.1 cation:proton antiporter [Bacillota bacterium]
MSIGLAAATLGGLLGYALFSRIRMPGLLGMLLAGIVLGPYGLNLIHHELIAVSADLREMALIIILLRAGLEMSFSTIAQVGRTALLMSLLPASFELLGVIILAPKLLGVSTLEAAILGAVLSAVSPAVVVPSMIDLQQRKIGTDKGIPATLIAAASVDDVFVIVVFTSLLGMYLGNGPGAAACLVRIPISILSGCVLGAAIGLGLIWFFGRVHIRDTVKALTIISLAIVMVWLESLLAASMPMSGLLAVMAMGVMLLERDEALAERLRVKFEKLWVGAQILLFVLVGAQVDISVAWRAGLAGLAVIFGALAFRCVGVWVALIGSKLNFHEKLFCMLAYIPKATVQAAIGAVPLAVGVESGELILAVAVLSILTTAPLGATAIKLTATRLLTTDG